jgi:hypothetical protein
MPDRCNLLQSLFSRKTGWPAQTVIAGLRAAPVAGLALPLATADGAAVQDAHECSLCGEAESERASVLRFCEGRAAVAPKRLLQSRPVRYSSRVNRALHCSRCRLTHATLSFISSRSAHIPMAGSSSSGTFRTRFCKISSARSITASSSSFVSVSSAFKMSCIRCPHLKNTSLRG